VREEEEEKGRQEGKREPGPDDSVEQQRPLARWNFQKKSNPFAARIGRLKTVYRSSPFVERLD